MIIHVNLQNNVCKIIRGQYLVILVIVIINYTILLFLVILTPVFDTSAHFLLLETLSSLVCHF